MSEQHQPNEGEVSSPEVSLVIDFEDRCTRKIREFFDPKKSGEGIYINNVGADFRVASLFRGNGPLKLTDFAGVISVGEEGRSEKLYYLKPREGESLLLMIPEDPKAIRSLRWTGRKGAPEGEKIEVFYKLKEGIVETEETDQDGGKMTPRKCLESFEKRITSYEPQPATTADIVRYFEGLRNSPST